MKLFHDPCFLQLSLGMKLHGLKTCILFCAGLRLVKLSYESDIYKLNNTLFRSVFRTARKSLQLNFM